MVSLYSLYASFSFSALCSAWFLCCSALKAGYIKSVIIVYMLGFILIIAGHIRRSPFICEKLIALHSEINGKDSILNTF